ncbi:MAG TPA: Dabb family protein [Puia sp.]|nr:Dabb family protein [Puia sp.]
MEKSNRRKFLAAAAVLAPAGYISANSFIARNPGIAAKSDLPLVHHVFFWLKDPASKDDRDKLIEGLRTLAKIDTVKELRIGVLASTEKRDVVDTSWQVSELIFFHDLAGQSTYQAHAVHLDFVKNYSHLWAKVVVYDAMEA